MRIIRQVHDSGDFATLHVDDEMFSWSLWGENKSATEGQKALVSKILSVPGVREVSMSKYRIMIERGRCFQWEDIERAIVPLLDEWKLQNTQP